MPYQQHRAVEVGSHRRGFGARRACGEV